MNQMKIEERRKSTTPIEKENSLNGDKWICVCVCLCCVHNIGIAGVPFVHENIIA